MGNDGLSDFNWDLYESECSNVLKQNKKVKVEKGSKDKCYCHAEYAQEDYNKYANMHYENVKDVQKGSILPISDINVVDDNTLIATVGEGANNIIIDLNKETKFFNQFTTDDVPTDKEMFVSNLKSSPEFKRQILSMNLTAKIGTDVEKGSIWDGYVESINVEMKEQITRNDKAYFAEVLSTNGGGFVVEVAGTVKAFMPGSMAASNRISDYDSLIGKTMEVMVESWNKKYGFVVSRKKYLNMVRPLKLKPIIDSLNSEPDKLYTGTVTGATQFGIFVELDEYITGMLHKTLVSDSMRDDMREGVIKPGDVLSVYVHKVENNRVILSDVPSSERDLVIKKREAEDNAEKSEHMAQKNYSTPYNDKKKSYRNNE
jgi:predicted RNA-binding protein with RPS1 domain